MVRNAQSFPLARSSARPGKPAKPAALSRLPHPSWRQAVSGLAPSAASIDTAEDFWDRIGV